MKTTSTRKRPKSPSIQPIEESAPWVLISKAAEKSGVTELLIRKSGLKVRKFGNADYIAPTSLNAWINADGEEKTQP